MAYRPELLEFHRDSGFSYRITDLRAFSGEGVAKLLFVGAPSLLKTVEKGFEAMFGDVVTATSSLRRTLCLTVSKSWCQRAAL
jgi:hypothetical protein